MAKTYILTPSFTIPPPPVQSSPQDEGVCLENTPSKKLNLPGSLFLGDIITDPLESELIPINRRDRLEVPAEDLLPVHSQKNFQATRKELLSGRFGLMSSIFASLSLPAGVDISMAIERNSNDVVSIPMLETHEFVAEDGFVRATLGLKSVQAYLDGYPKKKQPDLYMITGLKVARTGAGANAETTTGFDASLAASVAGADALKLLEITKSRTADLSFEESSPFILGFRVRALQYKRGEWSHRLHVKGASMMDGGPRDEVDNAVQYEGLGDDFVPSSELVEFGEVYMGEEPDRNLSWVVPVID